jgi:hypothetical protein
VKNHLLSAAAVAALALGGALLAGPARRAALAGAAIASLTGLASLWAFGRFGRTARRPVQQALLVFTVMFLVRIVLIGVGLGLLVRAGDSALAFVVAFFVPYFAFTAIEGSFVHSLGRGMGKPA